MEHESIPTQPRDVGFDAAIEQSRQSENGRDADVPDDEPVRITDARERPTVMPTRRIPISQEWVKFSGDYAFMEIKLWVDAPSKIMEGLGPRQGDETAEDVEVRVFDTLGRLVLAHRFDDGTPWADNDGELPPPQRKEFWDRAPQPLVNAIIGHIRERVQAHPTLRRSSGTARR